MRVYTHYFKDEKTGVECRWRTLLQIGEGWDCMGSVYMKNPGSSIYQEVDAQGRAIPIQNADTLALLEAFTQEKDNDAWYEFRADSTMRAIESLFVEYAKHHACAQEGVIQVFNLFNVRDADLVAAKGKLTQSVYEKTFTIADDVTRLKAPVYMGWGDLWKDNQHRANALKVLDACKTLCGYLDTDNIEKNMYYHPQYLMLYGKNKDDVKKHKLRFFENCILSDL